MPESVPSLSRRGFLTATTLSLAGCASMLPKRDSGGDFASLGEWPAYEYDQQNTGFRPGNFDPPTNLQTLLTFETTLGSPTGFAVGERTVFLSFGETLYAVAIADGSIRWKRSDFSPFGDKRPILAGGRVFVGRERGVSALDARDGTTVWTYDEGRHGFGHERAVRDGVLYVATDAGDVLALAADSGEKRWSRSLPVRYLQPLTVTDERVYATMPGIYPDKEKYRRQYGLYALNRESGGIDWSWRTPRTPVSKPAVADGVAYVAVKGRGGSALDAESGSPKWRFSTKGASLSPAVVASEVYLPRTNGGLSILDATTGDATEQVEVNGKPTALAATYRTLHGNRRPHGIYVGTSSGTVHRIGRADDLLRSVSLGAPVTSLSVRDKFVFAGTADGNLHVLGEVDP